MGIQMRSFMKKRIVLPTLVCLGFGLPIALTSVNPINVDASQKSKVLINDTFNNKANAGGLDNETWNDRSSNRIAQSSEGSSYLTFNKSNDGGESLGLFSKKLTNDINYFQYDFKIEGDRWITPTFVSKNIDVTNGGVWNKELVYNSISYTNSSVASGLGGTKLSHNFDFKTLFGTDAKDAWLTCRVTPISKTEGKINFKLQNSIDFDASNEASFMYTYNDTDLMNAYVGVMASSENAIIHVDNLLLNYGENQSISEDFNNFDFDNPAGGFTFFKNSPTYQNTASISDTSTLTFSSKENDFILSKKQIGNDTSIIKEVEIADLKFDISFSNAATNEKLGIVFGLGKNPADLYSNSLVYEISKDKGELKQYENGVQTLDTSKNTNVFSSISTSGSQINIKIYKSGKFLVYENSRLVKDSSGSVANFPAVTNFIGYFAIASLTDIDNKVIFDNVKLTNTFYYVPVTKSVTHNFSSSFFGNKGEEDFILMDGDGGGKMGVEDGKLVFNCGTDGTFFGSSHQYDDFILDFKLCSILADTSTEDPSKNATTLGRWIGLDLSRENKTYGSYGKYATLITQIVPDKKYGDKFTPGIFSDSEISIFNKDDATITVHNEIPLSLMENIQYTSPFDEGKIKESDAICFRFVSNNGNLKLYLKTAGEVNYTLYYEIDGLELNGYFALCCTGFTFIKIDDFSMSNTSSVYVNAPSSAPETIVEKETEVIYDKNNPDTNIDDEIRLNTSTNYLAIIFIATSVIELVGIGVLVTLLIRKKKNEK